MTKEERNLGNNNKKYLNPTSSHSLPGFGGGGGVEGGSKTPASFLDAREKELTENSTNNELTFLFFMLWIQLFLQKQEQKSTYFEEF